MNESIELSYFASDEYGNDEKRVIFRKQSKEGLNADTVCEAFVDFMESAGFSVDNVYNYFNDEEKSPW